MSRALGNKEVRYLDRKEAFSQGNELNWVLKVSSYAMVKGERRHVPSRGNGICQGPKEDSAVGEK